VSPPVGNEQTVANSTNIGLFKNGLNDFFGGQVDVQINSETGDLQLSMKDGGKLTDQQQNAYDFLQNQISSTSETNYGVSSDEGDGKFFKTDVTRDNKQFSAILNVGLISQLGDGGSNKDVSSSNVLYLGLTKGDFGEFKKGTGIDIKSFDQGISNTFSRKEGEAYNTKIVINDGKSKPTKVNLFVVQKINTYQYDVNYKGEVIESQKSVNLIRGYPKVSP
jgi:hypothetical protein